MRRLWALPAAPFGLNKCRQLVILHFTVHLSCLKKLVCINGLAWIGVSAHLILGVQTSKISIAFIATLQVYEEVSGIVTSIMDGYNACIMAYGQTGSGKTYTIEGRQSAVGLP